MHARGRQVRRKRTSLPVRNLSQHFQSDARGGQGSGAMIAGKSKSKTDSKSQTMLRGIVGDKLEKITRDVPLDEPPALPENAQLSAIGKSVHRFDAAEQVTGRARYTSDVQLLGMLYARRVVSSAPHARVKAIDTSAAEKYPGVRAVHILERDLMQAQLRHAKVEAR